MLETTVVVIGGGATGMGTLRDLCMRGIPAILVEQGGLAHGTSSRFHGLLHSGGRYAVTDNASARECIEENRILNSNKYSYRTYQGHTRGRFGTSGRIIAFPLPQLINPFIAQLDVHIRFALAS